MGTLYVVGTPIGNLGDLSYRAEKTLAEVDMILCEDTRVTKKLLARYSISTPCRTYHQHTKLASLDNVIRLLNDGKNVALVSDAGTPGISDPGGKLIAHIRSKSPDVRISVIPGPTAATAALSASGLPTDRFTFLGFPPHKKGRMTFFKKLADREETVVFYESPHRILKAFASLAETIGDRRIVIARELTKIHEHIIVGTAEEHHKYYESHPDECRGEFVVIIEGK